MCLSHTHTLAQCLTQPPMGFLPVFSILLHDLCFLAQSLCLSSDDPWSWFGATGINLPACRGCIHNTDLWPGGHLQGSRWHQGCDPPLRVWGAQRSPHPIWDTRKYTSSIRTALQIFHSSSEPGFNPDGLIREGWPVEEVIHWQRNSFLSPHSF